MDVEKCTCAREEEGTIAMLLLLLSLKYMHACNTDFETWKEERKNYNYGHGGEWEWKWMDVWMQLFVLIVSRLLAYSLSKKEIDS
jgi:hypothetical protein